MNTTLRPRSESHKDPEIEVTLPEPLVFDYIEHITFSMHQCGKVNTEQNLSYKFLTPESLKYRP